MRAIKLPLFALAGATMTVPAMAQEAAPAPAAPAEAAPQAAAPVAVTDAEVDQFANAVLEVDKINNDAAVPADEKQTQMAAAVTATGLTADRFNTIATAINTDSELQAKVGAAIQAKGPAATEPAPAQ